MYNIMFVNCSLDLHLKSSERRDFDVLWVLTWWCGGRPLDTCISIRVDYFKCSLIFIGMKQRKRQSQVECKTWNQWNRKDEQRTVIVHPCWECVSVRAMAAHWSCFLSKLAEESALWARTPLTGTSRVFPDRSTAPTASDSQTQMFSWLILNTLLLFLSAVMLRLAQ